CSPAIGLRPRGLGPTARSPYGLGSLASRSSGRGSIRCTSARSLREASEAGLAIVNDVRVAPTSFTIASPASDASLSDLALVQRMEPLPDDLDANDPRPYGERAVGPSPLGRSPMAGE